MPGMLPKNSQIKSRIQLTIMYHIGVLALTILYHEDVRWKHWEKLKLDKEYMGILCITFPTSLCTYMYSKVKILF